MSSVALSPAERAAALVAQMNITEKINMVHGWGTPYVGGVIANTRLGIPALNLNDGPQVCHLVLGVRNCKEPTSGALCSCFLRTL